VQRLDAAQHAGRLDAELDRLRRIPLLVCDEVGYIPFAPEAAALFYALVANRYERASLIVSSNKPFSAWTEIFGDAVAVAAMVDRPVHHAEIINLKATATGSKTAARRSPANDQTVQNSIAANRPGFNRR
jgi:DNA replication protein DnaC